MRSKAVLALLCAFILSGCMIWDAGYTENKPVVRYSVSPENRVPISYSVEYEVSRNDLVGEPTRKSLTKKIDIALKSTGLFSSVSYGEGGRADSYHVAFKFRVDGMSVEDSMAVGLCSGYTLLLVPTGEVLTFDGSAILMLKGQSMFSTARAEELRDLIWLPLAPVGLVMNVWTAWMWVEDGVVNALVNDVVAEHKRRFLADVDVLEMSDK